MIRRVFQATAGARIFKDRQKQIRLTAASEARMWRENTRVGMRDRVHRLEEVKCWIGVQKWGENGYDQPLSRPARVRNVFLLRSAQLFRANNGIPA